jgi:hypothetical protein
MGLCKLRRKIMNKYSSRFTPIDNEYATCELTEVTLAVYNIDPDLITNKLGLKPTRFIKKGISNIMPSGVERIGRINSWLFSSENEVKSKDLRQHLDWILDMIEPVSKQLFELQRLPDIRIALQCIWWSKYGEGGPTLWPEQMNRMAKLNLECTFSFAWYGNYDEKITPDQLLVYPGHYK